MKEEIANVSAGVPGTGVTPEGKPQGFGDPIVKPKAAKTWKKMNAMLRRRSPVMEQQIDETDSDAAKKYGRKALVSYKNARDKHVNAVTGLKSNIPPEYVTGTAPLKTMEKRFKGMTRAANIIQKDKKEKSDVKLVKESATMAALAAGSALGAAAAPHINKAVGKGLDWLEKKRKQKHQDHYDKKSRRVVKEETFAGAVVFEVSAHTFHNAKMEKRKGKHWRTYLDECDELSEIRQYANKHPKKAIVLQNRNTNEMVYVRYGKDR